MPTVALDFSKLDRLSLQHGLYRYMVDLINGLARVESAFRFVILGSRTEPAPEIIEVLRLYDGRIVYHELAHQPTRKGYWLDHLRYWPVIAKHRVDLLHCPHTFIPAITPCPVVRTVHDLMYELFPEYHEALVSRPYRIVRWLTKHRAARSIAISECTAGDMERVWKMDRSIIDVVPHGVTDFFSPAPPVSRGDSAPCLLSPFNLEPRKNLDALLMAFAEVLRHQHVRLVLYGRAAWTEERQAHFDELCGTLGIAQHIERPGFVTDEELRELYRRCDLFVFPSLYEGFGLPVLEAMACGACVVARGLSAMAEIVGDAGVLVEAANPTELAGAILELLQNAERRAEHGNRARLRSRHFTIDRMVRGTLNCYLQALGHKSAERPSIGRPVSA